MRLFKEHWRFHCRHLCGFFLLLCMHVAHALSPDRPIPHFSHVWYENQLPQSTVLSIAQQTDGTLWLATYGGLVRHSGEGFETLDPRVAPSLKSSAITAVAADAAGSVWVGTLNGGLYRYVDNRLEPVVLPAGIESVIGIVHDKFGSLWLTTNAGVVRIENGIARLLDDTDGFPPRSFYRGVVADGSGGVWIAADGAGVVHWNGTRVQRYDKASGLPSNAVYSLTIDAAGVVWAGTQAGPAFFTAGRFHRHPALKALVNKRIYTLHGDREGAVWFAPLDMGLCRLVAEQFSCDANLAGLQGETVRTMLEDQEGNLWLGTTSSGLHRLSQSKIVTILNRGNSNAVRAVHQAADGRLWVGTDGGGLSVYNAPYLLPHESFNKKLPSQLVRAIITDEAGQLWVAGSEGVTRFDRGGMARNFGIADGMPGTIAFAFAPAREGGMWVATLQGVTRIEGDRVHVLEASRGEDVRALHQATDGRLWIGHRRGLSCYYDGVLDACGTDGLAGASVFAFHESADGSMWLGTSIGIMRVSAGTVVQYLQNAGFYGDAVFVLLDDKKGNFWFSSNRGIGYIAKADLDALDAGRLNSVEPKWYGTADGMLYSQANGASQTPAVRTADGRMWFGTAKGVAVVDPERMQGNLMQPPVAIERLIVDGTEMVPSTAVRLGPGIQYMEIHFAAMSYVAPSGVRYRYRLEGFDRDWRDAGSTRKAHYTNLPPGDYVFHVMASNNDGVWNKEAASLHFQLLPLWYQTWWVRLLAVLAVLTLIISSVGLRLRASARREQQLTREVARRTEALREANALLERLAAQDALTGIANRREFNRRLLQAWEQAVRHDSALSVLLIDVDDFKAYNDTHGHLAGDAALAAVAGLLSSQLPDDECLAARYGGEEFALLLPGQTIAAAQRMGDALVAAIRAQALPHNASRVCDVITISVGVASILPSCGGNPEELLHAADKALYRAKDQGRNQAVAAELQMLVPTEADCADA